MLVDSLVQAESATRYGEDVYSSAFSRQTKGLHLTARLGLLYLMKELLKSKQSDTSRSDNNADVQDDNGRTPLSYAAECGQNAVAKLLIVRKDVHVQLKDNFGRNPLLFASMNGHDTVARLIIERNRFDNLESYFYFAELWAAAEHGQLGVVKLLLDQKTVKPDERHKVFRRTALSLAAANGHDAVVEALIRRNDVDVNTQDSHGLTPLSYAAARGHEAVVRVLMERRDVDLKLADYSGGPDCDGHTALWHAQQNGHEEVAKLLQRRLPFY